MDKSKMKSNIKIKTTPKEKEKIVDIILKNGWDDLTLTDEYYLFLWGSKVLTGVHCEDKFDSIKECEEISFEEFLKELK